MSAQNARNFIVDGSDRSVQDTVSKLKFISKIREGEKLDVQSLRMSPDTWATSLHRTFLSRGESRDVTLEFIRGVIAEAFELAAKCLTYESDDRAAHEGSQFFDEIGNLIIRSLQESKVGIENLAKTYNDDRLFSSKLDTLTSTLDSKTVDLRKLTSSPMKSSPPEPSKKNRTGK